MQRQMPFDKPEAVQFTNARQKFVGQFLTEMRGGTELRTAADIGCGVGHFSKFLSDLNLRVVAVDGRPENTAEAKQRFPEITFITANAESLPTAEMGAFDLVLCFGLLYHLENPFRAIRSLRALTGKLLLIESMCAPGDEPSMELLDEYEADDQGLDYVAFYPTESCLVKMLYRAGFPRVYGFARLPNHEFYEATASHRRRRTMLVASKEELKVARLKLLAEPKRPWDIWQTRLASWRLKFGLARGSFAATVRGQRGSSK